MIERLHLFRLGWKRRNAMMLDAAGYPMWLMRARCPAMYGWGFVLEGLAKECHNPTHNVPGTTNDADDWRALEPVMSDE